MAEESVERARESGWPMRPSWPDFVERLFADWPRFPAWRGLWDEGEGSIAVEEKVEDGTLVIRAELPGIDPDEDVEIHVQDHTLHIEARRREEERTEEEGRYRSEFRYGRFVRNVTLPPDADENSVAASYEDGILEVRMPVDRERAKATRIEVRKTTS